MGRTLRETPHGDLDFSVKKNKKGHLLERVQKRGRMNREGLLHSGYLTALLQTPGKNWAGLKHQDQHSLYEMQEHRNYKVVFRVQKW